MNKLHVHQPIIGYVHVSVTLTILSSWPLLTVRFQKD